VPIKRVAPNTPADVRSMIRGPVSIAVTVEIDPRGNVTQARTSSDDNDKPPLEKLLAREAVEAAREWQFRPATRDDAPVTSQMVVQFQFTK
jgi:TonB family protein